jgi:very-short-patch-repair endonuclease
MSEIPNSVHFSTTSSLFDIAKIKMTDMVTLTEHFRCIEELIGFSNKLSYKSKLKILRDQLPKDRLDPVLEPIFVDCGFEETNGQMNKAEAEKIVEKLQEMLADDKYKQTVEGGVSRPTTFGVISLLGKEQSKYITKLISEKISSKEIEERGIICGDPYTFQGDERDIILLSMVKGCDQDNPNATIVPYTVNKKENKQRVNVAMSRARNKMILFHSIPKDKLQNPDDLRKMIIDWFYNHKTEERKAGLQRVREEVERGRASEFEYEIAEILISKGYKVIPQWEVAGYRIDLVVQGENSKLAIECDGDKYHNAIEKWHEDIERQQILERSGWIFWRLSGSAFYRHKEKALDSLWPKLDELKIYPVA